MPPNNDDDYSQLYRTLYPRLSAQLYAYLADAAEAEDVVQEAFARAWRAWERVRGYGDPAAWIRRVAWNLATSRWRHLVAVARHRGAHRDRPATPAVGPDHVALVAALRSLPGTQRRAIVLHYLADLPVAEVAAEMSVPRGTVLSWLHRGRVRLAERLAEDEPYGPPIRPQPIRSIGAQHG